VADFRVGDCLVTLAYGSSILTKGIQYFQRYMLGHNKPDDLPWRSTHVETVLAVTETRIITGSQTFPKAKHNTYKKSLIRVGMIGDRPRYALFRFHNYSNIVTEPFVRAMVLWWEKKIGKKVGFLQSFWGGFYDVGQLLMYPINWIADKLGHKKHIAWLEKTKANVCSDASVSSYRAGLTADGKQEDYIFEGIPSSEVAPSHFWMPESKMMRIL